MGPELKPSGPLDRLRVLVIDDEPLILKSTARLLRRRYEVVTANSAEAALTRIQVGEWFDAVLCDVNMPQLSGPEVRDLLGTVSSQIAGRFIWMSGRECPVDGPFVSKPFTLEDVTARVSLVCKVP